MFSRCASKYVNNAPRIAAKLRADFKNAERNIFLGEKYLAHKERATRVALASGEFPNASYKYLPKLNWLWEAVVL